MKGSEIDEAIAGIRAGLAALRKIDLSPCTSVEVVGVLDEVEVVRREFEPLDQRLLAEVVTRGIAGEYARTSPADLLVQRLHVRPGEAKARLTRAAELGPRRDLGGVPLDAILPDTAAALDSGEISGAHADVIIKTLHEIPDDLEEQAGPIVQEALLDIARRSHPGQVDRRGQLLLARLDPDGVAPSEEEKQRKREFGLRSNPDGTFTPFRRLTSQAGAVWRPILDTLAKPCPAEDGTPDPRTAGQRGHDAFHGAGTRLLRADLPDNAGTPVTLSVIMRLDEFVAGTGTAETSTGDLVAVAEILKQAADAQIIPVVLNDTSGVLSYGKGRRLAGCDQRRVLAARDRGCSFPGCTRPPAWCQTHHVIAWRDALIEPPQLSCRSRRLHASR